MDFEQRNAAWNGWPREFRQLHSRSGTPRVWSIQVMGNTVNTTWGQLGGQMQTASEHFNGVNAGKTNELSPAAYALSRAREMCRKKGWEGYREWDGKAGSFLDPIVEATIDFDALPLSLSFYKPDNSMGSRITKLAEAGQAWYTRKRNGMMKVLCMNTRGELNIYSRRMLRQHDDETQTDWTWDDRFPHLIHTIEKHLPPRTILLGELVVEDPHGNERFDLAQSYIKSLTPKAVRDMEESGLWPFFYCWDVAFWNGEDFVSKRPVQERFQLIEQTAARITAMESGMRAFQAVHIRSFQNPDDATAFAKQQGWEGFVVVDPSASYGDKAYNFKGKPDRPGTCCAKLKPVWEDDFIAIWDPEKGYGERSTKGSRAGGIKSVGLYQYDKKGMLVFIANCNSGLTKEMLAELANPSRFPQVWKVEYTDRRYVSEGDDTNAVDFPRYVETRTDKKTSECINERL